MFAIVVHAGAGFHSPSKEPSYKSLCLDACNAAVEVLSDPSTEFAALEAVTAAVSFLEDSPLTNAGFGSCLNHDGYVECDAGLMCGKSLLFTSVGSVSCIKNPIQIPRHLLLQHLTGPVSPIGRVRPLTLCGEGAKRWASDVAGLSLLPDHYLISKLSKNKWRKYRKLLVDHELNADPSSTQNQLKKSKFDKLDTVGAVCLDLSGDICAASSSGGIPLKLGGRLGQACVYGCGSWAEVTPTISVGCVTSGTGEQLIKTQLAQRIASKIIKQTNVPLQNVVDTAFQCDFFESRFLANESTNKLGCVVGISKTESSVEFFFKHSTDSLAYGLYVSGQMKEPLTAVSRKSRSHLTGSVYYAFSDK